MSERLRLLLVEDCDDDAALLLALLQQSGYDVQSERVQDAPAMRAALGGQPWDLIICDYRLPQFNAPAALKVLQEFGADIPFIVVSGTVGEDAAVEMMRAGAHDYLLKDSLRRLPPAVAREIREARTRGARRHAEAALRDSEQRLSLAVDATELGTFDFDPDSGQMLWSPFAKRHFGLTEDAAISYETFLQGLHPEDRERVVALIERAFRPESGGHFATEHRTIGIGDGVERWLSAWGRVVFGPNGRAQRFVGVSLDISEQKRMESALRESAKREADANRVKDDVLANLSHELRTPLNVILGRSRMLLEWPGGRPNGHTERTARVLRVIERNASAQLRIVEDLLDVQRIVAGNFRTDLTPCDLTQLGQTIVDSLMPSATAKRLRLTTNMDSIVMTCDGPRIQQVMWNLLSNAIKFTPENGWLAFDLKRCDGAVIIRVADNGEGMPADFLPHVFERFQQLDMTTTRRHNGLGLGLHIAKHVVELHGGKITAESPGRARGSTFTVTLPLREEHDVQQSRSARG